MFTGFMLEQTTKVTDSRFKFNSNIRIAYTATFWATEQLSKKQYVTSTL